MHFWLQIGLANSICFIATFKMSSVQIFVMYCEEILSEILAIAWEDFKLKWFKTGLLQKFPLSYAFGDAML